MKILWVKSDFLHPTTRGGQIRSLEILRRLHRRHEIHYVAFDDPATPEGLARSSEYCSFAYPIRHSVSEKTSPVFAWQLAAGLFSTLPIAISRYQSRTMRKQVRDLMTQHFDAMVCDFLLPAPNFPELSRTILFQHNVEAMIWKRHAENAPTFAHALYFRLQANRMLAFEKRVCRSVKSVIAVSANDADSMRDLYGVSRVCPVPTGVDLDFLSPRLRRQPPT